MTEKLKRRDVVKAVAAAGGLLALGGLAGAAQKYTCPSAATMNAQSGQL